MDAEVPFLCGRRTLENWKFLIDGRDKILEINNDSGYRMKLKMVDTKNGHYAIVLETKEKDVLYLENDLEDELGVLFLEDKKGELCSFKAVRKVHEVNRHKQKDQMIAAYRNAGWMSPEIRNTIQKVVNNCKVCK